jgi:hypothetical protein
MRVVVANSEEVVAKQGVCGGLLREVVVAKQVDSGDLTGRW